VNWTASLRKYIEKNYGWDRILPAEQPIFVKALVYTFGVLVLSSLLVLIISGIILAANGPLWWFDSKTGMFVRAVHYWGVQSFFFFLILHFITNFFMGAWRDGRAGTWILGMIALGVATVTAFTGFLSRGDFYSQWNQVQAKDAFNALGVGAWFNVLDNGKVYGLHVVVLPAVLLLIIGWHLVEVRRHGVVKPYPVENKQGGGESLEPGAK
jgi:ubiquinol-cytochrome c reductase cytochrome b subunit